MKHATNVRALYKFPVRSDTNRHIQILMQARNIETRCTELEVNHMSTEQHDLCLICSHVDKDTIYHDRNSC